MHNKHYVDKIINERIWLFVTDPTFECPNRNVTPHEIKGFSNYVPFNFA